MSAPAPLDRLRTSFEARQASRTSDVALWEDGTLVARVGMVDATGARDALRTLMRLMSDEAGDLSEEELAGVIAAATTCLMTPGEDGELEPLLDEHGAPLSFDARFGAAIGYPQISKPSDAVLLAFTEGSPPTVNALRLLTAATTIAGWLIGGDDAEAAVTGP